MKRYIRCTNTTKSAFSAVSKYYKIDRHVDPYEVEELMDEYASAGLEYLYSLEAKSKYERIFDIADISHVSVCKRKDGSAGVFVLTSYGVKDISDPDTIEAVIDRVYYDRGRV